MVEVVDKRGEKLSYANAKVGDLLCITDLNGARGYYTIVNLHPTGYNAIVLGGCSRLTTNNYNTISGLIEKAFRTWLDVEYIPSESVKVTVTIENA